MVDPVPLGPANHLPFPTVPESISLRATTKQLPSVRDRVDVVCRRIGGHHMILRMRGNDLPECLILAEEDSNDGDHARQEHDE
jgi:hypothetical protein